ncbi:MAG: general secretion pathway protein GspK [Candidatus Hydrogenedentota bacterium]|nr:MAG: general secretion pathway protein GspK [Candidatus Hydrogenedentota bacterium]
MRAADQKGIAILSALGVLVILGLLSSVFLAHVRLEAAYAARDAQQLKAHYLAVAGVQDAIARLKADSSLVDAYTDGWWLGSSPEATLLGEGGYTVTVTDESARINIVNASPQILSAILGSDKEALAAIVSYRSANRLFAIEDLHAADLGADPFSRVSTLGTTLGDGKVNINTANADVVAALPGMDPEAAQMVIGFRKGADGVEGTEDDFVFAASRDLAKVPGLKRVRTAPVIPVIKVNSNIFRVEAVGSIHKGAQTVSNRKVTAVLRRDDTQTVRVISWEGS